MLRKVYITLTALTLFSHCCHPMRVYASDGSQGRTKTVKSGGEAMVLGIKLRPKVQTLLKEVETLYGKSVEAEFADISERAEGGDTSGKAIITDDGRPTIKIDKRLDTKDPKRLEGIIAHELLHLRLRTRGFPVLFFHGESGLMESIGPYLLHAGNSLRNGIEHWMFIPDMRAMGFDEVSEIKYGVEKFGSAAKSGQGDDVLLALYYYRARLEFNDPALLAKLRKQFVEGNRLGVIKLAERLAQVVLDTKPRTPDAVGEALLLCLDTLFQKQISFQVLPRTEKVSGSVVLPRINVQVTRGNT